MILHYLVMFGTILLLNEWTKEVHRYILSNKKPVRFIVKKYYISLMVWYGLIIEENGCHKNSLPIQHCFTIIISPPKTRLC